MSLIWNASTNTGITGYNVYYGSASRNYPNQVSAGNNLSAVVSGLSNGNYFFAVTAVDALGNESDFSNEINYQIAGVNQPPTISSISSLSVTVGQTIAPLAFTINDPDSGPSSLILSVVSSNPGMVPNGNIVFGGSGQNRTLTITPVDGQTGGAEITVTVSDGSLTAQSSFALNIQPVSSGNHAPTISAIADQSINAGTAAGPVAFTINDQDTGASGLTLSAVSSNTGLVPNGNVVFGGSGQNRTVTVTPRAGQTGAAQITVTVSDGSLTAQSSFTVNVQPVVSVNHAPTISAIADQSAYAGVATGPIGFTINDQDTGANGLILSAGSSNTGLVPNGNIVFGGSGQNRTVTITPLAGQTGAAQITVTVSDGSLTAQSSFAVNVQQSAALPTASAGKSTYNGLFFDPAGLQPQSAGAVKISVTTGGRYSGSVQMAAARYSFSGQFGALCQGTAVIQRKGANSLNVNFTLKPGSSGQLTGSMSDGTWTAQILGGLAAFNSKTNPAPYAGSYTLEIPGQAAPFSLGNGFGSIKVDGSGNVKLTGMLADGTKLSQSAPLSSDGTWPVFVPLYSGKGLILGWISFVSRAGDDLHGTLSWLKLSVPNTRIYPGGLAVASDAVGSAFVPGPQPFVFGRVQLQLGEAGNGLIMALKVSPTTGLFNGNILDRATGKPEKFQGALLDKVNAGYGFVLGTNQSTPVTLIQ
ncbi:MAG TPA: Ig-like domain-containing protein [Verrucomicrobiae bacterium]|nr:Ig-like domain-containing protein [Verrucomicrobiae bacterium]